MLLMAIGLLLAVASFAEADTEPCWGFDNYCGGTYFTEPEDRCYPTVTYLHATLIAKEPVASQYRCTFQISVSGEGFQVGYTKHFSTIVWERVDSYAPRNVGNCNTNDNPAWDVCVDCANSCFTVEIIASAGMQVKFWAQAVQWSGYYPGAECACESDTLRINVNDAVGTEATYFPPPTPRERGRIPCEARAGDPINITNGNVYLERADVATGSDLGIPLSFQRFYNSYGNDASSSLHTNWRHTYDYRLTLDTASGNLTLWEPDGRVLVLRRIDLATTSDTVTSYIFPYGVSYDLAIDTSGTVYTIQRDDDVFLVFDSLGPIDYMDDQNGNRLTMYYTGTSLDSVVDASGRSLIFGYSSGSLSQVCSSNADTLVNLEYYDSLNLLRRVRYADDSWEEYTYGDSSWNNRQIIEARNSDGVSHHYDYDTLSLAREYYLSAGFERVSLDYSREPSGGCPPDSVKTIVQQVDTSTFYATFAVGGEFRHIRSRIDPTCGGCPTEFEYNGGGLKSSVTYPNGTRNEFLYDSKGNTLLADYGANTSLAQTTTYEYLVGLHLPTREATVSVAKLSDSARTYYRYDSTGNLNRLIETGWIDSSASFADTTTFLYNSEGQLTRINGPRPGSGDTVKFAYYGNGDLRYEILPNGDTTEYGQRDELGRPTWSLSAGGDTTRSEYDDRGRLNRLTRLSGMQDSLVTSFAYSFSGNIREATRPNGNTLRVSYDSAGYIDTVFAHSGDYAVYNYDSLGNVVGQEIYTADSTLRWQESYRHLLNGYIETVFDAEGDSTVFSYDALGNIDTVIDPLGNFVMCRYDSLSRLVRVVLMDESDSITTSLSYNSNNNLIGVVDPNGYEYSFRFDDKGRKVFDSSGVTGATRFGYDPANNLTWIVNAASDSIAFTYDDMSRMTSVRYPDSQNVTYEYDGTEFSYGKGRLYMESTPACTTRYRYDSMGRLFQEILQFAADTSVYATQYEYDANSEMSTLTYPSGSAVTYVRDSSGRVTSVVLIHGEVTDTLFMSARYAPFGPLENWTLGNGIELTNSFDSSYQLSSFTTGDDSLFAYHNVYDALGNLIEIQDLLDSTYSQAFEYDPIGRLVEARCQHYPDTLVRFVYQNNSNRDTVVMADSETMVYSYSRNRLTQVTGNTTTSFAYDSLGNVVSVIAGTDTTLFTYNSAGRLVEIDSGLTATYAYDGSHRRVKKTLPTDTVKYVNASSGQVLSAFAGNGSWRFDLVYLDGVPIAKVINGESIEILYFITDHLGTPLALVDGNKTIRWRARWYPFGTIYDEQVNAENDVRFAGQWRDEESDLYYNWHRYYSHGLGRYLQADPIGLAGGGNLYVYATGDPIRGVDPFGLYSLWDLGGDVLEFAAGVGNAVSFGATTWIAAQMMNSADAAVLRRTKRCSSAFKAGEWASLLLGSGRVAYAATAKVASMRFAALGANMENAFAAWAFRNSLKRTFRLGLFRDFRMYTFEQMVYKYRTAEGVIAKAGRTNLGLNLVGVHMAAGGAATLLTTDDCECSKP